MICQSVAAGPSVSPRQCVTDRLPTTGSIPVGVHGWIRAMRIRDLPSQSVTPSTAHWRVKDSLSWRSLMASRASDRSVRPRALINRSISRARRSWRTEHRSELGCQRSQCPYQRSRWHLRRFGVSIICSGFAWTYICKARSDSVRSPCTDTRATFALKAGK